MADRTKPLDGSKTRRIIQYRNRAEELRVIAEDMCLESERETLRSIAVTYDELADQASTMAVQIDAWPA